MWRIEYAKRFLKELAASIELVLRLIRKIKL
jgi:hypothetical protein